ncbi:hypothetical protein WA158_004858 [Blastocystis sp. Blastoise]
MTSYDSPDEIVKEIIVENVKNQMSGVSDTVDNNKSKINISKEELSEDIQSTKTSTSELPDLGIFPNVTIIIKGTTLTKEMLEFAKIKSKKFNIRERYYIIYEDPFTHDGQMHDDYIEKDFSYPYVVRQTITQKDMLAYTYGILYESDYILFIDYDRVTIFNYEYLKEELLDSLYKDVYEEIVDHLENPLTTKKSLVFTYVDDESTFFSSITFTRQIVIRNILTKTTVNRETVSVGSYLNTLINNNILILKSMSIPGITTNSSPIFTDIDNGKSIQPFFCNSTHEYNSDTFSVTIGTYRRNYVEEQISDISTYSLKPKFITINQNLNLVNFDILSFSKYNIPILHTWCTNWNSKYYGRYVISSIFETNYNLMFDDDFFLKDKKVIKDVVRKAKKDHKMYGYRGYNLVEDPQNTLTINKDEFDYWQFDHIAVITLSDIFTYKRMFKYQIPTYDYGEDIHFSLTNYMDCQITTGRFKAWVTNKNNDINRAAHKRKEIFVKPLYNLTIPQPHNLFMKRGEPTLYGFYMDGGYIPQMYRFKHMYPVSTKDRMIY